MYNDTQDHHMYIYGHLKVICFRLYLLCLIAVYMTLCFLIIPSRQGTETAGMYE